MPDVLGPHCLLGGVLQGDVCFWGAYLPSCLDFIHFLYHSIYICMHLVTYVSFFDYLPKCMLLSMPPYHSVLCSLLVLLCSSMLIAQRSAGWGSSLFVFRRELEVLQLPPQIDL